MPTKVAGGRRQRVRADRPLREHAVHPRPRPRRLRGGGRGVPCDHRLHLQLHGGLRLFERVGRYASGGRAFIADNAGFYRPHALSSVDWNGYGLREQPMQDSESYSGIPGALRCWNGGPRAGFLLGSLCDCLRLSAHHVGK